MNPEDMIEPGTYIDVRTGDIWEKHENGKWIVNGIPHKPFPVSLTPYHDNPKDRELRDTNGYEE